MQRPFSTVLIANRGEIACRIMRTARARGLRTVAVYSDADRDAPHVRMADVAAHLGPPPAKESYLAIDALIDAAKKTGAEAIHPGYGFLSENIEFGRRVQDAGLVFIGPPLLALEIMGSKRLSKERMVEAGVPCVPGFSEPGATDLQLVDAARAVGLPIMIKASMGGGGKGLRKVESESELLSRIALARAEAEAAFGNGELILERAIEGPRHVEVQVFGDAHGRVIHLGERDCSMQRRHQKVIEEAPSPAVGPDLRRRMGEAAVQAARSIGYVGAGTVEFLLAGDGRFYFMEMNTRLQVEHPVTEMITGLDLVGWQFDVAAGGALPLSQEEVSLEGHAIEVRLYAEDVAAGFLPATGRIEHLRWPEGPGVRVDHGLREGMEISPHYDPMLAKIIAHGRDREDARRRLCAALRDTELVGLTHNRAFLVSALEHPTFVAGQATTNFVEASSLAHDHLRPPRPIDWAAAAILCAAPEQDHWRSAGGLPIFVDLECGEERRSLILSREGERFVVQSESERLDLGIHVAAEELWLEIEGVAERFRFLVRRDAVHLFGAHGHHELVRRVPGAREKGASSERELLAPMSGRIVEVRTSGGQVVKRGDVLVVMEAMKMQLEIAARAERTVEDVLARVGEQVDSKQALVRFAEAEGSPR